MGGKAAGGTGCESGCSGCCPALEDRFSSVLSVKREQPTHWGSPE